MKPKLTIDEYGTKEWKLPSGKHHREDGPAIEYSDGEKWWYINGLLHRENGSAIECANGIKKWFLYGVSYTEQEYKLKIRSIKLTKLIK
jgi:hypothetical protein